MDGRVPLSDAGFDRRHRLRRIRAVAFARRAVRAGANCLEAVAVESNAGFDGGAEVLPEMEPVCDLDRVGGTGAGTISVGAGPVTADDLDTGMFV
jgi:hypothetical protein